MQAPSVPKVYIWEYLPPKEIKISTIITFASRRELATESGRALVPMQANHNVPLWSGSLWEVAL